MFNVGGGELLVILLVALIVLGPQRLPGAARQVGKVMGDIRRISTGFQDELKNAFDAEDGSPPRRTEPVPLARAVADEDAKATDAADDAPGTTAGTGTDSEAGADAAPPRTLREVAFSDDDAPEIAPEVADALDEIMRSATSRPAPSDGDVGEPGIGGERAAS